MLPYLLREQIPCWYDLSWDKEECTIILKIHKDFAKLLKELNTKTPIIEDLMEQFNFESFSSSVDESFGFNDSFQTKDEDKHFLSFSIEMPTPSIKPCGSCALQTEFDFFESDSNIICPECWGKKQIITLNWEKAYAISASFTVLFLFPYDPTENLVSFVYPQSLIIQTATIEGLHGGSLSGTYLQPAEKWLAKHAPEFEISSMKEAMISAYEKIYYEKQNEITRRCSFRASIDYVGGWLNTSCPGDACGLNPDNYFESDKIGYRFGSHNVDTPFQQLTLLAGLAALCDEVRQSI